MRFRRLFVSCECGRAPSRINAVGFTAGRQLVLHWRCTACKKMVYVLKNLADCWRDCPPSESDSAVAVADGEAGYGVEDARFLHSIGVELPDTQES